MVGWSIDRDEWEIVQANLPGPVGQYYSPDDPTKPEVFTYVYTVNGGTDGLRAIPQYEPPQDDGSLPPYEWARVSSLPTPVLAVESWSSLHAAQREKSRLLETQSYISSRIAELDRKVRALMDPEQARDPDLARRYCDAQMAGALHAAGLPDYREYLRISAEAGTLENPEQYDWVYQLDKQFLLRERLSPVSLLSPPPAY